MISRYTTGSAPRTLAGLAFMVLSLSSATSHADERIFGNPDWYGGRGYATAPGDFDGNGTVDLLTTRPPRYDSFGQLIEYGNYTIYLNRDGQGSFEDVTIDADYGTWTLVVGDLNGDKAVDAVDDNGVVLLGNGDGSFVVGGSYDNGQGSVRALALGDMDNDNDLDIVVPNGGHVLLNDGTGSFYTNFVGSDVEGGIGVALCDVNEDQVLDIVTVDGFASVARIQLGLGDGQGNPGPPYDVGVGGARPNAVYAADMNVDGHIDLVTLNLETDEVAVVLGHGDGTFDSPKRFLGHAPGYYESYVLTVADVTGNDVPDVMVSSTLYGNGWSHEETSIFVNDGDGNLDFVQEIEYFGESWQNIVAADINDDNLMDLATGSHILFNQLDLSFQINGSCPGRMTFEVHGAASGGTVAFLYALETGEARIPSGYPCAVTLLGLREGYRLAHVATADASGIASFSTQVPLKACGQAYIQALDVETCRTTLVLKVQ
ncbi:MAG: VCBS repeat-containing protein [Planctomycetes bacterium]|nr:VCBS repeat-containing protein [Planctomycetota bacterium]NOG56065.1 VCBS repeat-containing protein [Planctomycetota bacterium]